MRTSEALKAARLRRGDSQERAAVMCRTNRSTWSAWEAGETPAKFYWLGPLSEYTGIDADELALMIVDDMRRANLLHDASPIPGLVARLNYPGSSGRFRSCASRTPFGRHVRSAYGPSLTSRPSWVGATCSTSGTSCVARV